ncbi:MAG: hypothetical protein K2M65_02140, partial [Muribaculaceae bacterium]|nr:hypothetical protein [Muribaculaceae bacterium]
VTATSSTAGGLMARGVTPVISNSFNLGDVTNSKKSLGSTVAGAGGILGKGDPIITDVYNMGTVTAEKNLGGIIGYYNSSTKTATITRTYQAGRITSTIDAPTYMNVFVGRVGKLTLTDVYYDKQVVYNLTEDKATALTTAELAKANIGEAWTSTADALPVLKTFADNEYARLYSAAVFLSAADNVNSVSAPFTVSTANGVTWTGDNAAFKIDGNQVIPVSGVSGEHSLTATLGNLSRTITLTLTGATTGIDFITADDQIEAQYYNLQGVRIDNPVAGQIYVVIRGQKATKELYR